MNLGEDAEDFLPIEVQKRTKVEVDRLLTYLQLKKTRLYVGDAKDMDDIEKEKKQEFVFSFDRITDIHGQGMPLDVDCFKPGTKVRIQCQGNVEPVVKGNEKALGWWFYWEFTFNSPPHASEKQDHHDVSTWIYPVYGEVETVIPSNGVLRIFQHSTFCQTWPAVQGPLRFHAGFKIQVKKLHVN